MKCSTSSYRFPSVASVLMRRASTCLQAVQDCVTIRYGLHGESITCLVSHGGQIRKLDANTVNEQIITV